MDTSIILTYWGRIILSIAIFLVFYLVRKFIQYRISLKIRNLRNRYAQRQLIAYIFNAITIFLIVIIWYDKIYSLLAFIGIIAAALVIISKDLLLNFITQWIILFRGLFSIGDRIQIDKYKGEVLEMGPAYFTLAEVTINSHEKLSGGITKVPNALVLIHPIVNYSKGLSLVWQDTTLLLTKESDWELACEIGTSLAKEFTYSLTEDDKKNLRSSGEEVVAVYEKPRAFIKLEEKYNVLTLRYMVKIHQVVSKEYELLQKITNTFAESEITLY